MQVEILLLRVINLATTILREPTCLHLLKYPRTVTYIMEKLSQMKPKESASILGFIIIISVCMYLPEGILTSTKKVERFSK